jgi:hypothetical protein
VPAEPSEFALRREHAAPGDALLSDAERVAVVARQDAGTATAADWALYERDLEARMSVA